jgi:hypothetical protein
MVFDKKLMHFEKMMILAEFLILDHVFGKTFQGVGKDFRREIQF